MTCLSNEAPSELLVTHSELFSDFSTEKPILDLACGAGRNGLFLANRGRSVVFADRDLESLKIIKKRLKSQGDSVSETLQKGGQHSCWNVDLESEDFVGLENNTFGGIVVFRYLHRVLFDDIKSSIVPGGVIIYETFNLAQAEIGRPKNPNFLLKKGELRKVFDSWEILHSFEGIKEIANGSRQAISQIVARKPSL